MLPSMTNKKVSLISARSIFTLKQPHLAYDLEQLQCSSRFGLASSIITKRSKVMSQSPMTVVLVLPHHLMIANGGLAVFAFISLHTN